MSALTPILYLMGPTASGKTELALELASQLPVEIISVDSAMVYKEMDIGTAKPSKEIREHFVHYLVDIKDPNDAYSAGQFCIDAKQAIEKIIANKRIPLLVGGTMLYFRVLQQGLAQLPTANAKIRSQMQACIEQEGVVGLHAELAKIDPAAAKRIEKKDSQRIQRALEVFYLTGKTLTAWQKESTHALTQYEVKPLALIPSSRSDLHKRIALRFQNMLKLGLVAEVEKLFSRGDLTNAFPSMRSVGYRQVWQFLAKQIKYDEMTEQGIAATRQLAKRQLTWLRPWKGLHSLDIHTDTNYRKTALEWVKKWI
jgi:tRNA dimethylallyltransferase